MTGKIKHDEKENAAETGKVLETETAAVTNGDYKELEAKYKRALADYQNLLKRTIQEKMDFSKFANENLLLEILPIYDNLKTSFDHLDDLAEKNGWLTGIKCVVKQFKEALNKAGVNEIVTEGAKFDYHTMEALENTDAEKADQDGLVAREIKSGYTLHGKVIVPAKVAVWKFAKIE